MNSISGYEDPDFVTNFEKAVKFIPTDEVMRLLIYESTNDDWNPLIYCIYYQKLDILQWLCSLPMVNVRACLARPFILVPSE
jgi:hypothetical protein